MEKKYTIAVACQGVVFHVALSDKDQAFDEEEAKQFCYEIQQPGVESFTFESTKGCLVTLYREQLKSCVWWAEPIE